ncbi:MAG: hypothetical protein MJ151_02395, partial [Lachnospiraceae bacterium]|nr:hypothetical protein [Lachnospiraceae bacterium]
MIKFIKNLESKYGKYAVHNLNFYLTVIFALGLIIQMFNSSFYLEFLALDIDKFLHGQVWRMFTFLFFPPAGSGLLFSLLSIYVYYTLTKMLLMSMSDFRFNLFLLIGIIFQVLGGVIYKMITGHGIVIFPSYFIFSILLAFCFTYSDAMMLFYFIIPIKAKYIAYFELAIYGISFLSGNMATKIVILCFGIDIRDHDHIVVFVITFGRNISLYNCTKQTIHFYISLISSAL